MPGTNTVRSVTACSSSSGDERMLKPEPFVVAPRSRTSALELSRPAARCFAIVVASPALIRVHCHTPRQIQLANALCRLVEVAEATDIEARRALEPA